jgi:hypothetical protein
MWWRRPRAEREDVVEVLGPFLMRMDAKLNKILELLRDEDDEAESES